MAVEDGRSARDRAGGAPPGRPGRVDARPPATAAAPRPARHTLRRLLLALVGLGGLAVVAFLAGFVAFADRVPRREVALAGTADGIVALTGGASRVVDAVELLASGRGRRLLITGVHRTTNSNELARNVPDFERLFACCIDLDHEARNTIGNAVETRRWTNDRGVRSLVVVTSSYHMPRAMAELGHRLPGVALIPYPVVTPARAEPWWASAANARLLMTEYVKYIVALARIRIEPVVDLTDVAQRRPRPPAAVPPGPAT
ncbi:YdcF family protein [Rhodoplanes sp. SY1]|uniref:YdcF family protein n=1 Tax=Rhodoplanes sp. SY1 TaxID=3166646 RepID=UPI0038B5C910